MIDTLKLARRLEEAHLPKEQAEALADGLAEAIREDTITKADLTIAVTELRADLDKGFNRVRTELLFWMIGTVGLGVLVNHFWR
jgi:hypothetical protein